MENEKKSAAERIKGVLGKELPRPVSVMLYLLLLGMLIYVNVISFTTLPIGESRQVDILRRLVFLEHAIKDGTALQTMQYIFPEGACFLVTLYGLTWANLARAYPDDEDLFQKAVAEIHHALMIQESPLAVSPFRDTQVLRGIFWMGQRNLLLGRYLALLPESERPVDMQSEFHRNSKDIMTAFINSPIHHVDTYPQECWPADNIAALASLSIHDALFGTEYSIAYEAWKEWTLQNLDPMTDMAPGEVSVYDGSILQPARGCAASWSLALLAEIDPDFSEAQYALYREQFGIQRMGFLMFREFPEGSGLRGDVDSGPIVWGAGSAATGIGLAAAMANDDLEMAADIHRISMMFGFPLVLPGRNGLSKRFLLGQFPIGDAFLAWGLSCGSPESMMLPDSGIAFTLWRHRYFYLLSLLFLTIIGYRIYCVFRQQARTPEEREGGSKHDITEDHHNEAVR